MGSGGTKEQRGALAVLCTGPAVPSHKINKSFGYMNPRIQSQKNLCILVYLLSTKMEVVESGRQEGALTLPLDHWGFCGAREWKIQSHSMVPERVPHAHSSQASAHKSSHTDTHMHGGNKYFPYQRSHSLITQAGPSKRGGIKCSFFQGWERAAGEGKSQTLSPFAGWRFVLEFFLEERVRGNQLFSICSRLPFQGEAKSSAVSLKQNPMIVFRYFRGGRDRV